MQNEEVLKLFEGLELDPIEVTMLFDLLSEDDDVADQEEFLGGAMKLKNQARTVDMIQVLHHQTRITRGIEMLTEGLGHISAQMQDPWQIPKRSGGTPGQGSEVIGPMAIDPSIATTPAQT